MKAKGKTRPQGQIRQSQIITTFGPGAMVDLPDHSVIVGGLELWEGVDKQVFDERLTANVSIKCRPRSGLSRSRLHWLPRQRPSHGQGGSKSDRGRD